MCSIFGVESKSIPVETLREHFDRTLSRGPDMSRLTEIPCGYLGFHRLAIMGLNESGMQPFERDGSYVVCNGELYGFRPLKKRLEEKYTFQSDSDCEILLPLYEEYGLELFKVLDAEFALILYDAKSGRLIAARDPSAFGPCITACWRTAPWLSPARPRIWWSCAKRSCPFRRAATGRAGNLSVTPTRPGQINTLWPMKKPSAGDCMTC